MSYHSILMKYVLIDVKWNHSHMFSLIHDA
jgi:hypothetical protein